MIEVDEKVLEAIQRRLDVVIKHETALSPIGTSEIRRAICELATYTEPPLTAEDLVTDDVIEASMQALFEVGGRLIGATSGDWPPDADDHCRQVIRSWLIMYAEYNVPQLQER